MLSFGYLQLQVPDISTGMVCLFPYVSPAEGLPANTIFLGAPTAVSELHKAENAPLAASSVGQ